MINDEQISKNIKSCADKLSNEVKTCTDFKLINKLKNVKIEGEITYLDVLFAETLIRIFKKVK